MILQTTNQALGLYNEVLHESILQTLPIQEKIHSKALDDWYLSTDRQNSNSFNLWQIKVCKYTEALETTKNVNLNNGKSKLGLGKKWGLQASKTALVDKQTTDCTSDRQVEQNVLGATPPLP